MAKITLGKRPKNFPHTVKFKMLEGEDGTIKVSYLYRTRKEFGDFIDARMKEARERDAAEKAATEAVAAAEDFSLGDIKAKSVEANAEYITSIADGWDVEGYPFSIESVKQLCDELPAAALAIINDYRTAIDEGRLGN